MGQGTFTSNGDLAPTGSYPITRFGSAQTGYWPLTHLTDRDAIPTWQRTYGMMVYVKDVDSTYTLKSATLDNTNWIAFKQGSVDVSNLMKYGDTTSLSNRIDLKLNTIDLNALLASYLTSNNYLLSQTLLDSMTGIRTALNIKLAMTDTASLSNRIDQKLNKIDTATLSARINQRVSYTDSNTTFITLKQLRDSLATISSGSSGISLNVDRPITRTSLGLNGQNLGSGGKTVAQFLDAFFFPAVAATPPTTTFAVNPSTQTYPYSTWKNWVGKSLTVSFPWSVTNVSKSDATDDKDITSITLLNGATSIQTATPDNTILTPFTQNGVFNGVVFTNSVASKTVAYSQTYSLTVVDAQPNTVTKSITLTASAANALSVSGLNLTNPSPDQATNQYEYRSGGLSPTLGWTVNQGDESIVSQTADAITVDPALQTQVVTFPVTPSSKTFAVNVTGDIYGTKTQSITASWVKRLYCGVFTSTLPPDDPGFTFTSAQTIDLPTKGTNYGYTQLGGVWKNTTGYNFKFDGSGNQYLVFAYPEDGAVGEIDAFSTALNTWSQYDPTNNIKQYTQTFVNQFGYSSTYRYVFLTMSYKNATLLIRLQ